ncbi:MAG TPA: CHAT domain-containing protein [Kofleriaceae bacterium]
MTADTVLWLDLAEANQMEDGAVREHVPHGAPILRLTEHGAARCPAGTPDRWPPVLDAIDRLVREARKLEQQSAGCRFWVTGRAGLPAFFYLGYRLSKMAAVTFVHQARNGAAMEVMQLDVSRSVVDATYFTRTPWPIPHTEATTPAALVVSSVRRPADHQIHEALAERRMRAAGIVHAHSPARFDASTVAPAMREIDELLQGTCDAYAARSALAVFMAGPSVLAFLVGAAINPRACRDVQVFEFDGSRYALAYELPYPRVPDRNKVLFFTASPAGVAPLALDKELRAIRLERGSGSEPGRLEIETIPSAQAQDLFNALRTREAGAVHFSGHGETGELLFQDDRGDVRLLSTPDLAEILRLSGRSVRLVVLAACHSESHAEALRAHVECVVAMRGPVKDDDARRFVVTFYSHLEDGDSVQDAFDKGRLAMRLDRPVGASGAHMRDIGGRNAVPSADHEPPQLREREPGCASRVFLVTRRR